MLSALALLVAASGLSDPMHIVTLRQDVLASTQPLDLRVHPPLPAIGSALAAPVSSDGTFFGAAGTNPLQFVFPADRNGDGKDELVVMQRKAAKSGDYFRVVLYAPPKTVDGTVGSAIASSKGKSAGNAVGPNRVLLAGAIDPDGDGKDAMFLVREAVDGTQFLEIRAMPAKKNKKVGGVIVSDASFGSASDTNVFGCGADVDGDGADELVVIRRSLGQPDRLLVFEPPTSVLGETGDPIASDLDITPSGPNGSTNLAFGRLDREGDGIEELMLLQSAPLAGRSLHVFSAPAIPAGEIGAPLFSATDITPLGATLVAVHAFGLNGYVAPPPPSPPANLSGSYTASYTHLTNGELESLPIVTALNGSQSGTQLSILLPNFNPLSGKYKQSALTLDWPATPVGLNVLATGAAYSLTYGQGTASIQNGKVVIEGIYGGKKFPPGGGMQTVTGGVYRFVRQ